MIRHNALVVSRLGDRGGLNGRQRFDIDDWQRLNFAAGERVPVRMPGKDDVWLFVTSVTELPPVVWVTMGSGCEQREVSWSAEGKHKLVS